MIESFIGYGIGTIVTVALFFWKGEEGVIGSAVGGLLLLIFGILHPFPPLF